MSLRMVKDRLIMEPMRDYSVQYPKDGARMVQIFLRRDGWGEIGLPGFGRLAPGLHAPSKKLKKRYRSQERQPFVSNELNGIEQTNIVHLASGNADEHRDGAAQVHDHIVFHSGIYDQTLPERIEQQIVYALCGICQKTFHPSCFLCRRRPDVRNG